MSLLSANTLFHFTRNIDTLNKILLNGFRPSYSRERFAGSLDDCYIPMVCFCDIPLSQVHSHVSRYGKYGLGMDINWGVINGVNPVTYISDQTSLYNSIKGMHDVFVASLGGSKGNMTMIDPDGQHEAALRLSPMYYSTTEFQCYLKPYSGVDIASGWQTKFYDEKEWRYLPPFNLFPERNPVFLRIPCAEDCTTRQEELMIMFAENILKMSVADALIKGKRLLNSFYLKFEPINVKYIIVQYEIERRELVDSLRDQKEKYTDDLVDRLASRILTYEQIRDDF